jgi:histidinol phosphatase-like PHP family hydrolase
VSEAPSDTRPRAELEREVFVAGLATGLGHARDLPLDSHLHTVRSPDADAQLEAYCALAVERGLAELAITDHVDFDPTMPAYGYASFADRERDVREAAARWADRGLAVRFGVEVTYERRYEDEIRAWLRRHPHDYVIGSVHVSARSPYKASRVAGFVAGRPLAAVVEPYFDEVIGAARSGLFDTIGHLDFVKRYLVPHVMPADLAAAPEPAAAPAGDLPVRRDRRSLSRARRPPCDHRLRRPPDGVVLVWPWAGVSSGVRCRLRGVDVSSWWRSRAGSGAATRPDVASQA